VALESDIADIQNGTTKEGIHMGVMAGTLDLVQRRFAGAHIRDGVLCFDPQLIGPLGRLSFAMQFQGTPIRVTFGDGQLTLVVHREGGILPIRVAVRGEERELRAGSTCTFAIGAVTPVQPDIAAPAH
jgi:trehalose/maltose hydrolase-like predicted phosphorylase